MKKEEHRKKGELPQNIDTPLYTLYCGFKKISFTLCTYVSAKSLQNGAKFIQKLTSGFKNQITRILNNRKQAVESPNTWISTGCFCPKNAFLRLKHDIQRIYLTLLSTTCVPDSPNSMCHFWNHKSFLATQLLCIFIIQTLHTFYKSSPSASKFSDFLLFELKSTKFLMPFFKQNISFSSKFGSLFSFMRTHSSVHF